MRDQEPTVFIIDHEAPVLKGLEALMGSVRLRAEIYLSAEDFFPCYNRMRPGCLILEVRMPRTSGIEIYRRLRREGCDLPVIFLTRHGDVPTAVTAMRDGAFDFLEKPPHDQYLIDRVQAAIAHCLESRRRDSELHALAARFKTLSPREYDIVDHLMDGQTSKAIARVLGVSLKTVDFHRANIMRKAGVETVAELVYLLVKSGYSREDRPDRVPRSSPALV
jgi:two-component system, LuxR family, response regulator FixJ